MSNPELAKYLASLPRCTGGVSIEMELSEAGYRRLCTLAEHLAIRFPGMDLSQCLILVIEAGTDAVEQLVRPLVNPS